ncbi:hypothetical protein TPHA_0D01830 [Tetrapisispora phaffii CBS 4417]|uniref:Brl1/Brr6 domain-containing protein n=1 Tax=Tetrapisispora phaffii (strain ATCC 24235 / CBS 4417 / NBRC 1672 / NRRL Y-8282 / UCD 70-5) TaxID=1071381 RepID=G8BSK1_TETPH|nr:hypothetical protein TPHA_0D01830 [Tetrapisispora phaffii CBS 4417]CCE62822.1 hypothetical protein TPHA_0D01830 [Tetrapisispora phaffii CBS 4417]
MIIEPGNGLDLLASKDCSSYYEKDFKNQNSHDIIDKYLKYTPNNPSPLRKALEIYSDVGYDGESSGYNFSDDEIGYFDDEHNHIETGGNKKRKRRYRYSSDEERLKLLTKHIDYQDQPVKKRDIIKDVIFKINKRIRKIKKCIYCIDFFVIMGAMKVILSPSRLGILISSILYGIKLRPNGEESKYDIYYNSTSKVRVFDNGQHIEEAYGSQLNNNIDDEIENLLYNDSSSYQLYKEYGLRSRLVKPPLLSKKLLSDNNLIDDQNNLKSYHGESDSNVIEFHQNEDAATTNNNNNNNNNNKTLNNRTSIQSKRDAMIIEQQKHRRKRYDLNQDIYKLPSPFFNNGHCKPKYYSIYNLTYISQLFINTIISIFIIMIIFTGIKFTIKNEILDKLSDTKLKLSIESIECIKNYEKNHCGSGKVKAMMIEKHCLNWKSCINNNKDFFHIWQQSGIKLHLIIINGLKIYS